MTEVLHRAPHRRPVHRERDSLAWEDRAPCRHMDPELFDDLHTRTIGAAKNVCKDCPVQQPCLDYALVNREEWGIWGGLTPAERLALLEGLRA